MKRDILPEEQGGGSTERSGAPRIMEDDSREQSPAPGEIEVVESSSEPVSGFEVFQTMVLSSISPEDMVKTELSQTLVFLERIVYQRAHCSSIANKRLKILILEGGSSIWEGRKGGYKGRHLLVYHLKGRGVAFECGGVIGHHGHMVHPAPQWITANNAERAINTINAESSPAKRDLKRYLEKCLRGEVELKWDI